MKFTAVPVGMLDEGLNLQAMTYVHPTLRIDRAIQRTEATIANARKRHEVLVRERSHIREGKPKTLHLDEHGKLRRRDWDQ